MEVPGVLGAGGGTGPQTLPIDPSWENEDELKNQSHLGSGFVCGYSKLGLLRSESQVAWPQTREGGKDGWRKEGPKDWRDWRRRLFGSHVGKMLQFARGPKFSQSRGSFRKAQLTGRKKGSQPP